MGDCIDAERICDPVIVYHDKIISSDLRHGDYEEVGWGDPIAFTDLYTDWYIFQPTESGQLGFEVVSIDDQFRNFDYGFWNISETGCVILQEDLASTLISINVAGHSNLADSTTYEVCMSGTGANGSTIYHFQGTSCGVGHPVTASWGAVSSFNEFINVVEGQTYVLGVCLGWNSDVLNGDTISYLIDFTLSDDVLGFDTEGPFIDGLPDSDTCGVTQIPVSFFETVRVESISAANFRLTGPLGGHTLQLSGYAYDLGGNLEQHYTLHTDPPLGAGTYTLDLLVDGSTEVRDGCENPAAPQSLTFTVGSDEPLNLDLGEDRYLCETPFQIFSNQSFDAQYRWSTGATGPDLGVREPGTYALTVVDNCRAAVDTITFLDCDDCSLFLPNGFSPNFDGENDLLRLFSDCPVEEVEISVFDRWGSLVFRGESWNGSAGDGRPAAAGVYVVSVTGAYLRNGTRETFAEQRTVVLVR